MGAPFLNVPAAQLCSGSASNTTTWTYAHTVQLTHPRNNTSLELRIVADKVASERFPCTVQVCCHLYAMVGVLCP